VVVVLAWAGSAPLRVELYNMSIGGLMTGKSLSFDSVANI
jgi:hypothetical protein